MCGLCLFFFKQKTAYEMRIRDWSSDVCSSDLAAFPLASDIDHAARSAAGIFVAYILLCGLWLATGWHQGPNAVLMGTVAVAFFGGGDEPGKAIAAFGRFAVLSLFLAAILAYGLLPLDNDFPTFQIGRAHV